MPPRFFHRFILGSLVGVAVTSAAGAEERITPPLGVSWGEPQKRIEGRLVAAKATIVERRKLGGRDAWSVEKLSQPNLRRTMFYFRNGGLVEVEFQYQNPAWDEGQASAFFADLRQRVEARYGSGKMIARSKNPKDGITQSLVGYEWLRGDAAVDVIYFAAENADYAYRTVSLHYKQVD